MPWRYPEENLAKAAVRNIARTLWTFPRCVTDPDVQRVILDAAKVSLMLLFIIANAMLFAHVLTTERIPHAIAETIVRWGYPPGVFLIVVNILPRYRSSCPKLSIDSKAISNPTRLYFARPQMKLF